MYRRDPFMTLLIIACVAFGVMHAFECIQTFMEVGPQCFSSFEFDFNVIFVGLSIAMGIMLLTYKSKSFLITFGAYVLAEGIYYLFALFNRGVYYISNFNHYVETLGSLPSFSIIWEYIFTPIVFVLFAIFYILLLVQQIADKYFRFPLFKMTLYLGYAIAVINVGNVVFSYILTEGGFSFFSIITDMIFAVIYSFIYISVPKFIYCVF